ncbi:hypothetical protein F444_19279 [Phytophthora nicotianae P1976]|uniref:Uncharacterized protein n=1 Tax=Phytophthora nicotianae P1976 TaxID=1317066 RepID=A0A080Z8B0_PHYNI|nr:hypothetical protein F444_19279 [Phytophthora nicotianae P1976]
MWLAEWRFSGRATVYGSVAFDTELRLPLPDALSCRLTLKNGKPLQGCHDKCLPSPPFADKVVEGYRVLSAKVEEHFSSKLPGQQRTEFDSYVKQSNNAKQKQFGVICQESFELELSIYVPKPEAQTTLHPASAARIQELLPRVAAFLREQQVEAGPASQRYMAVTQSRLPDEAPMAIPDNVTFRLLQYIDCQQAAMDQSLNETQQQCEEEYLIARVNLHGVTVPLQINISALREAFGVTNYSLRPPLRPPTDIDTTTHTNNIEDLDHNDETSQ